MKLTAVKQNSLLLEKSSFNSTLSISKETEKAVDKVLNAKILIQCKQCLKSGVEKFCDGEVGLRFHTSRMHKSKKWFNLIKWNSCINDTNI